MDFMTNSSQFSEQLKDQHNFSLFSPSTFTDQKNLPAFPSRGAQGMKTGEAGFQGKQHGRQMHSHRASAHAVFTEDLATCCKVTGDLGQKV